jgi:hypothetical protein
MEFAINCPDDSGLITPAEENFGRSFLVLLKKYTTKFVIPVPACGRQENGNPALRQAQGDNGVMVSLSNHGFRIKPACRQTGAE